MSRLIAIDPGLRSGIAIFHDGKLADAFEVRPHEARSKVFHPAERCLEPNVTVAIEEQYMGAGKAFKSIRTLIEIAGYWRLLAESHGMKTMRVNPRSWQAILKVKGQGNARRAQLKKLSKEYAVALWGERAREWSDNITDACHIGRWALTELEMKGKK